MNLTGNTILITGGGTGIGRALAEALHARGNNIIITGRRRTALDAALSANPAFRAYALDVRDGEAIRDFAARVTAECPELNVVIHNAGIMRTEEVIEADVADAEDIVSTNLLGPIRLTAALLPHLLRQHGATVMTVSSGLAFVPGANTPTYCATKAAIHSYSQSLRYQLRDTNVEVLELIPPYVQTELTGPAHAADPNAMPLSDFINEVMDLLNGKPEGGEICVERVRRLRNAEANGNYFDFFTRFNDNRKGAAAARWKGAPETGASTL